jgi:hypothetical protein
MEIVKRIQKETNMFKHENLLQDTPLRLHIRKKNGSRRGLDVWRCNHQGRKMVWLERG